ncbi:MAG TPA: NlpC/P60 family protein [Gaiellaceae bacterium]
MSNRLQTLVISVLVAIACVPPASASNDGWASAQIARVTKVGVLGSSTANFGQQEPLTEGALATALRTADELLNPPAPTPAPAPIPVPTPAPTPTPVQVLSSIPMAATIAGTVGWQVELSSADVQQVAYAVDGTQLAVVTQAPFALQSGLVTTALADGTHQLAVSLTTTDGGVYVAAWTVTVANAPGSTLTSLPTQPASVTVTKRPAAPPAPAPAPQTAPTPSAPVPQAPIRVMYAPREPSQSVTISGLDAVLVRYLDLAPAAAEFEQKLRAAGLEPKADAGTEIVARLLNLRYTHPSSQVNLALLPFQSATRAEAAYSFAQLLELGDGSAQGVQSLADSFSLPQLSQWQRRIIKTAVSYIGYPYVWGGTSPTAEAPFGVQAPGGFDCSGFAWRVFKLTSYANEHDLASVLRGRTTYEMSGEVPVSQRISAKRLQPADAIFFGTGPHSSPSQVDHMGIYLGNGWFIHSSGEGVTIVPFDGWYAQSFAWARDPLKEAGLE